MAPLSLYTSFYISLSKSLLSLVFARLYTPQTPPTRDLSGQTAIITGANSGIGLSIATALAQQGATVCLACRNLEKANSAVKEVTRKVGENSKERVFCWELDTSDLDSVRSFCNKWNKDGRKIDMLVHNAGIAGPPPGAATSSKDGLEMVYATNFLGSFLMTHLLESSLSRSARVVFTSSTGSYSGGTILSSKAQVQNHAAVLEKSSAPAYARSKALQVLLAQVLQDHFEADPENERSAHAFTPGFTSTSIFGKFQVSWKTWFYNPLFATLKATERYVAVDTDEGAKTGAWLASCGDEVQGGGYWEWMARRTSIVDLMRGLLGEDGFKRAVREQWKAWEKDAGIEWRAVL